MFNNLSTQAQFIRNVQQFKYSRTIHSKTFNNLSIHAQFIRKCSTI